MKTIQKEFTGTLSEVLVKTTYQTSVTKPDDTDCANPVGYGCGFIINYKNTLFFVTADHIVHFGDYDKNKRTGVDYVVSIYNNVKPKENPLSTVVTPLGGFYYMERFNILKPKGLPELIDVSVCIMKERHFQYPFLTDEVHFPGLTIKAGESKFIFNEEHLTVPDTNTNYFIYGKIKYQMKGIRLYKKDTIKEKLKYIEKPDDYYLFNAPTKIQHYDDWAGLSGSPVISETGSCVGVLCSVNVGTKSIFVMPIDMVKMFMDIALQQELLNANSAN